MHNVCTNVVVNGGRSFSRSSTLERSSRSPRRPAVTTNPQHPQTTAYTYAILAAGKAQYPLASIRGVAEKIMVATGPVYYECFLWKLSS